MTSACCKCGRASAPPAVELRPYGPAGAPICFDCAFASPEDRAETERQFQVRLESAERAAAPDGGSATVQLTPDGPRPVRKASA